MSKKYPISLEVAGPLAMFSRPDTGSDMKSYICPTMSAAKGIFESIFYTKHTNVIPVSVKICAAITFTSFSYGYSGLLRKNDLIRKGSSQIINETILENVRYQIFAMVETSSFHPVYNPAHAHQDQFMRNIKSCRCRNTPYLGRNEMICEYWGPLLPDTSPININRTIPSMLTSAFNNKKGGPVEPSFAVDVKVDNGFVEYNHGLSKEEVEICLMS